jgi:hypothetical protein
VTDQTPTPARPRDEYGRLLYADHEIPPISDELALWRGMVTVDGLPDASNTTTMHRHRSGYDPCVEGWVRSGDWWLHCGYCRSYGDDAAGEVLS